MLYAPDKGVQKFWAELPHAKFSTDKRILSLVEDTNFLGNKCYGNNLLIRGCYHGLIRAMESHFSVHGMAVIVTGNPGIFANENVHFNS